MKLCRSPIGWALVILLWIGCAFASVSARAGATLEAVAGRASLRTAPLDAATALPWPIARSANGSLYFAYQSSVYRLDPGHALVTRVAGNGDSGAPLEGVPADRSPIGAIAGLAVGPDGTLYLADWRNSVVLAVDPRGVLHVLAGRAGVNGDAGDGGPAANSLLNMPYYVAVAADGSVYVADYYNGRVRRIQHGLITTLAGTENSYPLAVAVDRAGTVYFLDDSFSGYPDDVIRKIVPGAAAEVVTATGLGTGGFAEGLSVDAAGNLYTTNWMPGQDAILRISPAGAVTRLSGAGHTGVSTDGTPAAGAPLAGPYDVVVAPGGAVYFTEGLSGRVRAIDSAGRLATLVGAGNGDGGSALNAPLLPQRGGLAADRAGNLYLSHELTVRRVSAADGRIATLTGSVVAASTGDGGPAAAASLQGPRRLASDGRGNLYIADDTGERVRRVAADGTISTFAGTGVRDVANSRGDGGPATEAALFQPFAVAADGAGNVYLGGTCVRPLPCFPRNPARSIIRKVDAAGLITRFAGIGVEGDAGDGGAANLAMLRLPSGLAADGHGNVYICDSGNHRIRRVDANGIISAFAGTGVAGYGGDGGAASAALLNQPMDVAVDSAGNVYVADFGNNVVRKVTPQGVISTLAGNGLRAPSRDHAPATATSLDGPISVAVDGAGQVYVQSLYDYQIRKIQTH